MVSTPLLHSRASLLGLPRELQDAIFVYLKSEYPRTNTQQDRTLLDLSYTCKALRVVSLPFMYEDIKFTAYASEADRSPGREAALLETISTSGYLGKYIKTLQIDRLNPADRTAEKLLEHTPSLTCLSYNYSLDYDGEHDPLPIDTERLVETLRYVCTTLNKLTIGYKLNLLNPPPPRDLQVPAILHRACSLKHLAVLEQVSIPLDGLLGWRLEDAPALAEVLPRGLISLYFDMGVQQRFQVQPEHEPMAVVLKPFVTRGRWKEYTPRLKDVSGHISVWTSPEDHAGYGGIEELYRRSKALGKLLADNDVEYPEDPTRLLEDNNLLPNIDWEETFQCTSRLMEWEELEAEELGLL